MSTADGFKIIVHEFPAETTEDEMRDFFLRAGKVTDCAIREGQKGKFAFVAFETEDAFKEAIALDGAQLNGSTIQVRAREKKICRRCGKEGHFAAQCRSSDDRRGDRRDDKKCFKCNRSGHFARDCPGESRRDDSRDRHDRRRSRSPRRHRRDSRDKRRDSRDSRDSRSPKRRRI